MRGAGALSGTKRRGRAGALAVSLALHGLALGWIGLNIARLRLAAPAAETPALQLRLVPALARPASAAARSDAAAPRASAPGPPAAAASVRPLRAAPPAAPSPADAAPAHAEAPGPRAPSDGPSGAAEGGDAAGLRGALRGLVGCAHAGALDLSPEERARCAERMGLALRTAPRVDPIPAEKRRYYDAVAQAYAETHFYATPSPWAATRPGGRFKSAVDDWREGVPPGHTAMAGCSPLFLLKGYKPRPHSLRIGPCVITPPRGTFTEEADVPDPPTLREREADAAHMRRLDPPKP